MGGFPLPPRPRRSFELFVWARPPTLNAPLILYHTSGFMVAPPGLGMTRHLRSFHVATVSSYFSSGSGGTDTFTAAGFTAGMAPPTGVWMTAWPLAADSFSS